MSKNNLLNDSIYINLPDEIIVHIASFSKSICFKLLNKELNREILKVEKSDEWKQIYNNKMRALTKMPALNDSFNWKMEYCRISKDNYFDVFNIDNLVNLEEINLWSEGMDKIFKEICEIPKEIGNLTKLIKLNMASLPKGFTCNDGKTINRISYIPIELGQLSQSLEKLDLSNNLIEYVPIEIGKLIKLEVLELNNNEIKEIHFINQQMINLKILGLENNRIKKLPNVLGELISLNGLYLSNNQIEEMNFISEKLEKLYVIELENNMIKEISKEINKLIRLRSLFLDNNLIKEIPDEFIGMRNLKCVRLNGNQISKVPDELKRVIYMNKNINYYEDFGIEVL